jgi:hypothetical protein
MTDAEKINKEYREGKISPWEHYVRVKESATKRQGEEAAEGTRSHPHNGRRLTAILEHFRRSKTPILA